MTDSSSPSSSNISNSTINELPAERISISWGRRYINELQPPPSSAQIISQCIAAANDDDDDDDDATIKANIKSTNHKVANTTDTGDSIATDTNTNNHPTTIVTTCDGVDETEDVESHHHARHIIWAPISKRCPVYTIRSK